MAIEKAERLEKKLLQQNKPICKRYFQDKKDCDWGKEAQKILQAKNQTDCLLCYHWEDWSGKLEHA